MHYFKKSTVIFSQSIHLNIAMSAIFILLNFKSWYGEVVLNLKNRTKDWVQNYLEAPRSTQPFILARSIK